MSKLKVASKGRPVLSKPKVKNLEETAKENVTAKIGNNSKGFEVVIEGANLDHAVKQIPQANDRVGMSKGITKNMENYESLRVDCWLSSEKQEDETIEQAFTRVSSTVDKVLSDTVMSILEQYE